jgi:hypothetical protein
MTADTYGHLFPRNDDGSELALAENTRHKRDMRPNIQTKTKHDASFPSCMSRVRFPSPAPVPAKIRRIPGGCDLTSGT